MAKMGKRKKKAGRCGSIDLLLMSKSSKEGSEVVFVTYKLSMNWALVVVKPLWWMGSCRCVFKVWCGQGFP